MAELIWSRRSAGDLQAIYSHVSTDSQQAAAALIDRITSAADRLTDFPMSGRVVPEFGRDDFREIIVGNYRVVYVIIGETVAVALVRHGARMLRQSDIGQT